MKEFGKSNRNTFGVFLLIVGGFLLLGNLDIIPGDIYYALCRWPSLLILYGLMKIIRKDLSHGLIVMAVGIFFLMPHLSNNIEYRDVFRYWPVLIILAGISFMFGKNRQRHREWNKSVKNEDVIDVVALFGGGVTKVESDNFQGGEITCIFGGAEVNFQSAALCPQGATIEFTTVFGGAKLMVPKEWNVKVEVVSIFGGFSDKRIYPVENGNSANTLLIKGTAIFGGGELRNI